MKTREQYLNDECSHRDYYSQFVPDGWPEAISLMVGKKRLMKAVDDESLNSIPLSAWGSTRAPLGASQLMEKAGDYLTLSGIVCINKEAARQWIEAQTI